MPEAIETGKFLEKVYAVEIEVKAGEGDSAAVSVTMDRPFILTEIRHVIISDGTGNAPTQDGAYKIDWSEQGTTRFYKGPVLNADAAFGSVRHGRWRKLNAPLKFGVNVTLEARVINSITRTDPFTVQVQFHGIEPLVSQQ